MINDNNNNDDDAYDTNPIMYQDHLHTIYLRLAGSRESRMTFNDSWRDLNSNECISLSANV